MGVVLCPWGTCPLNFQLPSSNTSVLIIGVAKVWFSYFRGVVCECGFMSLGYMPPYNYILLNFGVQRIMEN